MNQLKWYNFKGQIQNRIRFSYLKWLRCKLNLGDLHLGLV
jgi:hypothetical protein